MIPKSFAMLKLPPSGYLEANGPFFANWDGKRFVLGLLVEDRHCNSAGTCHGGMIASVCDVLLTVGGNIQSGESRFLPTVSMNIDFIAAAPRGSWIEGQLEILRTTASLMFAAGLLKSAEHGVIARTSGVLSIRGEPDPRFHSSRYFD